MDLKKWEIWENLTISNDFIFSKLMRYEDVCREALEILLEKKIGYISYIDNQKVIDISYDSKSIRLDVYVEDENRIYNVEMQVVHNKELPKRSRYYQGMIDLNAIEKGKLYRELKDSIIIFICKFDPFGSGLCRYTFENICVENKEIYLKDGTSKIFFNTKGYDNNKRGNIECFLEYIETNKPNSNAFVKKIRSIKENKEWRAEYMKQLMKEREIAKDSFEKGREKGRLEGVKEGELRGEARGIKRLINTCRRLNASEEDIINSLFEEYGLSEEEARKYL